MANPEHVEILRQGVEQWNVWREDHPDTQVDLRSAQSMMADLTLTDLRRADLRHAVLASASFEITRCEGANFEEAGLLGTIFKRALLDGSNFANVVLGFGIFANVDLSGVRNLSTAIHLGPSTVGIDTIYKSAGKYPKYSCVVSACQSGLSTPAASSETRASCTPASSVTP